MVAAQYTQYTKHLNHLELAQGRHEFKFQAGSVLGLQEWLEQLEQLAQSNTPRLYLLLDLRDFVMASNLSIKPLLQESPVRRLRQSGKIAVIYGELSPTSDEFIHWLRTLNPLSLSLHFYNRQEYYQAYDWLMQD